MFLTVINKGNSFIVKLNTIDYYTYMSVTIVHLNDCKVVGSFPVPIMYFQHIPILGKAWFYMQFVCFKAQSQQ